jgi:translocation protein SEC62
MTCGVVLNFIRQFPFISAFFLQTDRPELAAPLPSGQLRPLQISSQQQFAPTSYYTWFLAPSALYTYLGSALLVLVVLGGVMFPLWPPFMRLGVYYLSLVVLGLIGLFIGIALVRLVVWLATSLVMKRGVWWFPNLFEDVGFVSFATYTFDIVR